MLRERVDGVTNEFRLRREEQDALQGELQRATESDQRMKAELHA